MSLSIRPQPYIIPEYSLTGDLLAYLTCGLQYRYHNKGSLPPSTPVQLWFGEFIHSVMGEAYLEWRQDPQKQRFPWNWIPEIRDIELEIDRRLRARGLNPTPRLFCPFSATSTVQGLCPDTNHPHMLIASQRAYEAINTWGAHLFPLISKAEVRLKGTRELPNYVSGVSRCNYYGITGIIDIISSVNVSSAPAGNLIIHHIDQDPDLRDVVDNLTSPEYEIIIDYKGMRRPPQYDPHNTTSINPVWLHHEWQILTYAWLRAQQLQASPIIAGILFYLNELAPSAENMEELQPDVASRITDLMPRGQDLIRIQNWRKRQPIPQLSRSFRERRSIRIIHVDSNRIDISNNNFDLVVDQIENAVLLETAGNGIMQSWTQNPVRGTCTACDFKTSCTSSLQRGSPTVP